MSKRLYLMRHGQTLFNVLKKIQGWCDSPLTEAGIQQAKEAAKFFEGISLDHAYCSTAERASDTLELVLENSALSDYERVKGLKEMYFGMFEGESESLNPKNIEDFEFFFVPYGGERLSEAQTRISGALQEIMSKADHQNVLAVSHSGSCANFLIKWEEKAIDILAEGIPNCCIFVYEFEDNQFRFLELIRPLDAISASETVFKRK